jgi:hypothetical protein
MQHLASLLSKFLARNHQIVGLDIAQRHLNGLFYLRYIELMGNIRLNPMLRFGEQT